MTHVIGGYMLLNFILVVFGLAKDRKLRRGLGVPVVPLEKEIFPVITATFFYLPFLVLHKYPALRRWLFRRETVYHVMGLAATTAILLLLAVAARADGQPSEAVPDYDLVYIETVLPHVVCFMLVSMETGEPVQMSCTMAPPAPITKQPRSNEWTPTAATTTRHW